MIPVGLSIDLRHGDIMPARHYDEPVVLWRDAQGIAHAWEDRCPHRGVRLSLGFMRNDRLACQYHGWQFDRDGHCRVIPAHPSLNPPSTIRTRVYEVVEKAGMLWVDFANRGARAAIAPAQGNWYGVRSLAIRAPENETRASLVLEEGQWRLSADRLLALHTPQVGITMVHVAVSDESARLKAAQWLTHLRDTLEEIVC